MLVRLLLALMLALGAMPSAAMPAGCHKETAMMAMPVHQAPHRDHQTPAPEHGCIGCAAMPDRPIERIAGPPPIAAMLPRPCAASFTLRAAGPPRLPPPRTG